MKSGRVFFCLFALFFVLASCGWFGKRSEEEVTGQPTLTSGDFPDDAFCVNRDVLPSDTTFLTAIRDATELIHFYDEYTDDLKLPAVCGLSAADNSLADGEVGWDPSAGVDLSACNSFSETISTFVDSTGFSFGLCRTGFGYDRTDNVLEGFPRGGTYRMDVCIANDDDYYNVRLRITITGDDVNKTWTEAGIEEGTDLEVFSEAGFEQATTEEAKSFVRDHPGGTVFTIRSGEGATTHLSVGLQVICVTTTTSCPTPDYPCN